MEDGFLLQLVRYTKHCLSVVRYLMQRDRGHVAVVCRVEVVNGWL